MSEGQRFHTVEELEALPFEELQALWELVPTERQRAYRAAYEREVKVYGAVGSDALEWQVADELLKRYTESALVPIGVRWARTPTRVQDAARRDGALSAPEDDLQPQGKQPPRKGAVVGGLLAVMLFAFMLMRLLGGTAGDMEVTPEVELSPTPAISATPTALALEEQDEVIEGGDGGREVAYPVSLQMVTGDTPPRVWVVQRRRVATSQWNFDPNPDTASFISGMAVRPVIGIPWSQDNALTFAEMDGATTFIVTMNTGAALRFTYTTRRDVLRSDTDVFRQIEPGLVLLLIGETDADGLPTANRTLVTAHYAPEQELTRTGELTEGIALPPIPVEPTPTLTPLPTRIPFVDVNVQIIGVTADEAAGVITTRLRLYNDGSIPEQITPDDLWIAFGYVENPPGPRLPAAGLAPFDLLPGQAADVTLLWMWSGEPYASLGAGAWRFTLEI